MRAKVFFHGGCFDGATSAALFADFYRQRHRGAELYFQAMAHSVGDPFADAVLDGDDNACLDFRYCDDPKMTWWFDHHVSAFQPEALREHFDANPSEQKVFAPTVQSCAVLLRDSLAERFAFSPSDPNGHWRELIGWADKIDGAVFSSASEAVELVEPALQLATWLAHHEGDSRTDEVITQLGHRSLSDIVCQPWVKEPVSAFADANRQIADRIKHAATTTKRVVTYDLADSNLAAHNKFIAYMLFPECTYTVGISATDKVAKLSVGSNPWAPVARTHNIAEICARYGGGGHPVVGGVSLPVEKLNRLREIAREITEELGRELV